MPPPFALTRATTPWLAVLLAGAPAPCLAQQTTGSETATSTDTAPAVQQPPKSEPEKKKKRDLLFAPIPLSNPTTGTGLAVGAVVFYNPNHEPQQWVTGGGAVYTDTGTKGVAGFHTMSLGQDRLRIRVILSYIQNHGSYYGIGAEAGDRDQDIELKDNQLTVQLQGMMRVFPHGYAGMRYKLIVSDAEPVIDEDAPPSPVILPPEDELHSTLSVIGPIFAYDTRDSATQPRRGMYASASWLLGAKALGNSFSHNKLQLSTNVYFPFGPKTVLATRASLCATDGDVPYYDLCQFGNGADLRGYAGGRYRDRASWALQGELRQQISNRWGGVAFFGLGGIAPSGFGILDDSNLLPSAGVGVRYRPFKNNDVQLRLDVALGKNDAGFYFGISEAF